MTRRHLLAMIGVAAAGACRAPSPASDAAADTASLTLTISGMI